MQTLVPVADRGALPPKSPIPAAAAQATVFICANSSRGGVAPASSVRERPALPEVQWPFSVHEIVVPCAGKIQPEHVLKAFEAGASLVCVITCAEDNCHYIEGSPRAARRVEYIRSLLDEVGLGRERLLLFRLPGSAKEDMAVGCGTAHGQDARATDEAAAKLKAIAEELAGKLRGLGASPLRRNSRPA